MADLIISIPNEIPRRYPVPESFTYRELQLFKTVAGVRPTEMEDALFGGDPDIIIVLAMVCARRAGHAFTEEQLLDLEVGAITLEGDEPDPQTADEALVPASAETTLEAGGTPPSVVSTASDPGNSPT